MYLKKSFLHKNERISNFTKQKNYVCVYSVRLYFDHTYRCTVNKNFKYKNYRTSALLSFTISKVDIISKIGKQLNTTCIFFKHNCL